MRLAFILRQIRTVQRRHDRATGDLRNVTRPRVPMAKRGDRGLRVTNARLLRQALDRLQ
jgi:hypothetical protein